MIQIGTHLNVLDNSGAKKAICLRVYGYNKKIASIGDLVLVSVRSLRNCNRSSSRVKKGELYKALIIRSKVFFKNKFTQTCKTTFCENAIVLLNKQNKLIGTRIFGPVPKLIRYTRFLRLASVSSGVV